MNRRLDHLRSAKHIIIRILIWDDKLPMPRVLGKQQRVPGVSSEFVDDLQEHGCAAGAVGGKFWEPVLAVYAFSRRRRSGMRQSCASFWLLSAADVGLDAWTLL
jgi:hypothetical protein